MSFVHQNLRGFSSKELQIGMFLDSDKIDIFCVTEHWLDELQVPLFNFHDYDIVSSFTRKKTIHGGSLIMMNKKIKCKEVKSVIKLSIERTIEMSCVEMESHIILCVYRPPSSDFSKFEGRMEDALKQLFATKKSIIVCGDFNVNILDSAHAHTVRLLSVFKSFGLFPLFEQATRTTSTTATCLDNIFCNCEATNKKNIHCFNSDHSGQKAYFKISTEKQQEVITYRPITKSRLELFQEDVLERVPAIPMDSNDPNTLYEGLSKVIYGVHEKVFKCKTLKTANAKTKFSDWATPGIHKSRNRLYKLIRNEELHS